MKKFLIGTVLVAAIAIIVPLFAMAAEFKSDSTVTVGADEVINDNLFVGAQTVTIDGKIDGDLFVGAYSVNINGEVTGNVFAGGSVVNIKGKVGRDAFIGGQSVTVDGEIGNDLYVGAASVILDQDAVVGRDANVSAGTFDLDGEVGRNLDLSAGSVNIAGKVNGDVSGEVNELDMSGDAEVVGNLDYTAPQKATMEDNAKVGGTDNWTKEDSKQDKDDKVSDTQKSAGFHYTWKAIKGLGVLLLGFILILILKDKSKKITNYMTKKPLASFGWGLLFAIIAPILIVAALVTIIGIPLSLVMMAGFFILLMFSEIFLGLCLGLYILKSLKKDKEPSLYGAYFLGMVIVLLVYLIPYVGPFLVWLGMMVGFGALCMTLKHMTCKPKENVQK